MERVEVFLMGSDLRKILGDLQRSRLIQSIDSESNRDLKIDPVLLDLKSRLEKILDFLTPMEPPVKGLKALLSPGGVKFRISPGSVKSFTGKWLSSIEKRTIPLESSIRVLEEDIERIRDILDRLSSLSGLDVDLETLSSFKKVRVRLGTTRRFNELKGAVTSIGGDIQSSLLDKKEGLHAVRITYTSSIQNEMTEALRGRIFTEMTLDTGRIRNILKRNGADLDILNLGIGRLIPRLESVRDQLERKLLGIRAEGAVIASELLPPGRAYHEIMEMEIEKEAMRSSLKRTKYTDRITGWIERNRLDDLNDILTTRCKDRFHLDHRPPTDEEILENKVPTKLKNGWLGTMFEPLTNTFAVPKYDELDPSLWISIPFILFFGLMLGDAGYGLLIMSLTAPVIIFSRNNPSIKMTAWMGFFMGLATTLSGIWMGAFFGDLVPRVILGNAGSPLFTFEFLGYQMPYDTLKDPMLLFQISLYIGLLQLNLGILLYGIDKLSKKDVFGFFKGTISWILIQVGGVIFVGALLIGWWELDTVLTAVGGGAFILGTILLTLESKGMVLFDIEGFVGDWISYTRILALGLSTFGLAMAFNIVGRMLLEASVAMIPIVFLLLVFLHIFNLLLQALGAAVHSLRLQFVEFFGRFYEGGGRTFEPFGMERYYTRQTSECYGSEGERDGC
jgi:V/A-type H+-transporting ATPase subunit I